jgi:hypothetical protein
MNVHPRLPSPVAHRAAGFAITLLMHVAMVVVWQASRERPVVDDGAPDAFVQWMRAPHGAPGERMPARATSDDRNKRVVKTGVAPSRSTASAAVASPDGPAGQAEDAAMHASADPAAAAVPADASAVPSPSPGTRQILEQARMEAGAIDRELRKSSKPYIVAPRDSPQIRMAKGFAEAAALAPNRWWEAPKVVELVNDGGDGARRTRVVTPFGIYCITERAPTTSIDMIEKHGRQRITNCGHEHEQPANPQEWRTARD